MFQAEVLFPLGIFLLSLLVLFVYFHQLCFFVISLYTARYLLHPKRPTTLVEAPGVSVVKPLMGVDGCLRENLLSHFTMNYPRFELLFCVQNENDPVIQLLQSLCEEYPHVNARLFIGGKDGVVNPMVHNMAPAYESANHDLVWVSTSRVKASTEVIWDFVDKASDPSVAIVHQLPFFSDHPGFVAAIEKVTFGCYMARSYMALNQLGVTCFTGMSYVVRKSMLDEVGGLAYFGKYLAEDYFLSSALCQKGYRIVISSYPVMQNVSDSTLVSYIRRMVRWLRLRLNMLPLVSGVLEPMSESITLGLLFSLTMDYLFDIKFAYLLIIHFTIWITLDYALLCLVQNSKLPFSFPTFLLAWITRELLVYVVFIKALSNPWCIKWGDHYYRVHFGGLTQRLPSSSSNSTALSSPSSSSYTKTTPSLDNACFKYYASLKNIKKLFKNRLPLDMNDKHATQSLLNSFYSEFQEENKITSGEGEEQVVLHNLHNSHQSVQQSTSVIINSRGYTPSSQMAGTQYVNNNTNNNNNSNNNYSVSISPRNIIANINRINKEENNFDNINNYYTIDSSKSSANKKIIEMNNNNKHFGNDIHMTTPTHNKNNSGCINGFVNTLSNGF
uniref:ceramide glucosyltransferase n=1 Tax=Trichobilharzia regenti TaxID=157069 RepID=A0AA85IS23_TRIRE|nr:unnamed protein product [Trichobilharzia regenti]